ncbi:MAG: hypothetical protein K9J16_08130 [Melioribacteraceae bacterium]|nr:hypothetical protein [Melioribacteraceae bacterium]MCF8353870.1 hypothetical protein [Melioribacteraceae bacterium]MCF8393103.1 hypothetical protein [Melioribacteraceae bacterium]MCF8419222.1 hypothetical protein [Melioribacteraceae bacterium]
MGFSSLLDVIGSFLIGGMLFMILLRMNDAAVENTYTYSGELIVQKNLVEVVSLLEHDFRKIGYCADWEKLPDPTDAIIAADSNRIKFQTDVDSDGNIDTLEYKTGNKSDLSSTPNPNDRILYRILNNESPKGSNLGVTEFNMVFFNALGDTIHLPVNVPSEIYTMQINITVENVAAYGADYGLDKSAFWRQIRMAARNLRNR